jgi:hypothetical protein
MLMSPMVLRAMVLAAVSNIVDVGRIPLAYIDPNTGGMIFQVLAIVFTFMSGILLFFSARVRMTLARFARRMRGLFGKDPEVQ